MKKFTLFTVASLLSMTAMAQSGTVTTRVWNDRNGDGIQQSGESNSGISGVTVRLLNSNGTEVTNTLTNASGVATFQNVSLNTNYKLKYDLPADHAFTKRDKGSDDNKDSDAFGDGKTTSFSLSSNGQNLTKMDAGMWAPGTVNARVWNDRNGDGIQQSGESNANINGVIVRLLESNGTQIGPDYLTVNGVATIPNVPADRAVKLQFVRPADHAFTKRDKGSDDNKDSDAFGDGKTTTFQASRGSQTHTHMDAGMWAPGVVFARAWNDKNGDGIQQSGESSANVAGVEVRLLESNGTQIGSSVFTGPNGIAMLNNVPADRALKLQFVRPADHAFTKRDKGSDDNKDSDAFGDGKTTTFQADRGSQSHSKMDAGLWVPGTVTARVWNDKNGDGIQQSGESSANIEGVEVKLLESNGNQVGASVFTGPNGVAVINNVPADRAMKVQFVRPADHAFTKRDKGSDDNKDSDAFGDGKTTTFQADRGSQNTTKMDAGLWAPGTVVARVWKDKNADGIQQSGESGLSGLVQGVKVELLESNGTPVLNKKGKPVVAYTQCGSSEATLDYVPADRSMKLRFTPFAGATFTSRDKGSDDNKDSDAFGDGKTTSFRAVRGSQVHTHLDAGLTQVGTPAENGTITTRVWDDQDGDGKQDGSENNKNISGAKVSLYDKNGKLCACETTNASGVATFNALPGRYRMRYEKSLHAFTKKNQVADNIDSDVDRHGKTHFFNLADQQNITTVDAGMWAPGTIQARVWDDQDGDGKQDGSENNKNVANVQVELLDASNNNAVLATTTTGANGIATFSNVPADRALRLRFTTDSETRFTKQNKVADDVDSDANNNSGLTSAFKANKGSQVHTNIDAGIWSTGTVVARVWDDQDGDGKQDGSENNKNIDGMTVNLLDIQNGNAIIGTAVTVNGIATISGVPSNRPVRLQFIQLADHKFTKQNKVADDVDSDANRTNGLSQAFTANKGNQTFTHVDAGVWTPGQLVARVWDDQDADGKQDGSENTMNIENVSVELIDITNANAVLATEVTNANGLATFNYVPADRPFRLRFIKNAGYTFTKSNKVADDVDSDANNNGLTGSFIATQGNQTFTHMDAGMFAPGMVKTRVWVDVDNDGKQDGSENLQNVAGLTVMLMDATNMNGAPLGVAMTDASGIATFTDVPTDKTLRLKYMLSSMGYTATKANKVSDDIDSDINNAGISPSFKLTMGSQVYTKMDAGVMGNNNNAKTEEPAVAEFNFFAPSINAFPVPAQNQITFAVDYNINFNAEYMVLDMTGRMVAKGSWMLNDGENQMTLNLDNLVNGVYIFRMQTEQGVLVQTFNIAK